MWTFFFVINYLHCLYDLAWLKLMFIGATINCRYVHSVCSAKHFFFLSSNRSCKYIRHSNTYKHTLMCVTGTRKHNENWTSVRQCVFLSWINNFHRQWLLKIYLWICMRQIGNLVIFSFSFFNEKQNEGKIQKTNTILVYSRNWEELSVRRMLL